MVVEQRDVDARAFADLPARRAAIAERGKGLDGRLEDAFARVDCDGHSLNKRFKRSLKFEQHAVVRLAVDSRSASGSATSRSS